MLNENENKKMIDAVLKILSDDDKIKELFGLESYEDIFNFFKRVNSDISIEEFKSFLLESFKECAKAQERNNNVYKNDDLEKLKNVSGGNINNMGLSKNKIIAAMLAALTIAPIATQSITMAAKNNTQQSSTGSTSDKNAKEKNNKDNNSKKGMSTGAKVFLSALFIFYGVPILYSNHTTYNNFDDEGKMSASKRKLVDKNNKINKIVDSFLYMFKDDFDVFDTTASEGYFDFIPDGGNETMKKVRNIISLPARAAAYGLNYAEEFAKFKISGFFKKA